MKNLEINIQQLTNIHKGSIFNSSAFLNLSITNNLKNPDLKPSLSKFTLTIQIAHIEQLLKGYSYIRLNNMFQILLQNLLLDYIPLTVVGPLAPAASLAALVARWTLSLRKCEVVDVHERRSRSRDDLFPVDGLHVTEVVVVEHRYAPL